MSRSLGLEATGIKLAALAAPLLAWMSAVADAAPEAPTDESALEASAPDAAPGASEAAPEAPADATAATAPADDGDATADDGDAATDDTDTGPAEAAAPETPLARSATEAPRSPANGATSPETPAARSAAAHDPAELAAAPVSLARAAQASSGTPWIGAMADLGVPDGATMSLVVRPIRSLRVHAGVSHNLISLGERAGLTWIPLSWWASPTLSVEYGQYTDGNANPLVRAVSGDTTFSSAVLDRVGYRYANAHLGLELGRRWFTFYIHAGMSRINSTIHNLSAETMSQSAGTTTVSFSKDPSVQLTTVSARIGFVVYLAK